MLGNDNLYTATPYSSYSGWRLVLWYYWENTSIRYKLSLKTTQNSLRIERNVQHIGNYIVAST